MSYPIYRLKNTKLEAFLDRLQNEYNLKVIKCEDKEDWLIKCPKGKLKLSIIEELETDIIFTLNTVGPFQLVGGMLAINFMVQILTEWGMEELTGAEPLDGENGNKV